MYTSNWNMFGIPLLIGAGLAVVTLIAVGIAGCIITDGSLRFAWLLKPVATKFTWGASDSWASNVAVAGTLFVSVANASSGFFSTVVPSFDPNDLTALFILLGAAVAIAPLAYGALASSQVATEGSTSVLGTIAGLFIASAFTLFAVFGQLGAISMAIYLSTASWYTTDLLLAGTGLAALLAVIYSVRSVVHLATDRANADAGTASRPFLGADRQSAAML